MHATNNRALGLSAAEVAVTIATGTCEPAMKDADQQEMSNTRDAHSTAATRTFAPVSAIIPTKNRPDDLRRTIQTLLAQTVLPREVVIVDQSADERSCSAVHDEFADRMRDPTAAPRLKYVRDSSIQGVSAARNHSMKLAEEAVWLFLDDDVVMEPEFIAELMSVYETDPRVDGVSGVITNYLPMPALHRVWMAVFARGPFLDRRPAMYCNADRLRDEGVVRVAGFSGGLMSFPREIASRGLFDARISDGEDVDFCLNLGKDTKFVISPRARLQHLTSPVGRSKKEPLWVERYAVTQAFLYHKHWRGNFKNAACYTWLCLGLGLASSGSAIRRSSLEPWRALITGLRTGKQRARL